MTSAAVLALPSPWPQVALGAFVVAFLAVLALCLSDDEALSMGWLVVLVVLLVLAYFGLRWVAGP